jgi:hypothetical protein
MLLTIATHTLGYHLVTNPDEFYPLLHHLYLIPENRRVLFFSKIIKTFFPKYQFGSVNE